MNSIARSSKFWFCIALCALGPLQVWFVADSPWFAQPPKPIGDGPDYENIAYQLYQGAGWSLDWTDSGWRAPYLNASLSQLDADDAQRMPSDRIPIADYSEQLSRSGPAAATTGRPPLLPLLVATIYQFVERGPTAFACVRICLALLIAIAGSMAVAMTAAVMAQTTTATLPVAMAAVISLALAALDRTVRSYATDFLTEPLAMVLMQLWILSLWRLLVREQASATRQDVPVLSHQELAAILWSGGLLALLIYTRSLMVLWIPGIWLLMLLPTHWWSIASDQRSMDRFTRSSETWRAFQRATLVMLVCLALVAPWWIRNCGVLKAALPLGTQGSITLLGGYNDQAFDMRGEWHIAPVRQLREELRETRPPQTDREAIQHEVKVAREASRRVVSWIRANMTSLPYLAWLRVQTEWAPYSGRSLIWKLAAVFGLWYLCVRLRPAGLILGGVLLINTLTVACLYSVGGRFLVPNYGVLYTLAGIGVSALVQSCVFRLLPSARWGARS